MNALVSVQSCKYSLSFNTYLQAFTISGQAFEVYKCKRAAIKGAGPILPVCQKSVKFVGPSEMIR